MESFDGSMATPLGDVRSWIDQHIYDGVICPACEQQAMLRLRTVTPALAYGMILVYQQFKGPPAHKPCFVENGWLHALRFFRDYPADPSIPTTLSGGGDFMKLRFYGFVEPKPVKGQSGFYRITEFGRAWVRNEVTVLDSFYMYNRLFVDANESEAQAITIKEVLVGSVYDYDALMQDYL